MSIASDSSGRISSIMPVAKRSWFCLKTFVNRLTARKPMFELQVEIDAQTEFRRSLNWIQLTAIGLGSIIGAGIIVLSGNAAAIYAGPSVIISFIITGIVAILAALSFSELSTMMCRTGAAYTYTYAALGEYMAWFIGWNYALLYQLGALTVVVSWSKHVVHFINTLSDYNVTRSIVGAPVNWNETGLSFYKTGQVINLPAVAITIAITIVLISGIRSTAIVNLVLVVFKILILLIFIFVCCKYVNRDNYRPFFPSNEGSFSRFGITGMLHACTYIFFAYIGFESVVAVAQEAKTREATSTALSIPFATIASVVISLFIYIGICTVMVGLVPYKSLQSDNPLAQAIKATPYGLWLSVLMDLGSIAALTTVALTVLLSQTRIFHAMARDGLLPKFFSKIFSRTKTPLISIIISGGFCAVISSVFPVDIVGETSSISALVTYLFVHIEVVVMRYTHSDIPRPFRVPFGSWLLPTLGAILCILLMTGISKGTGYRFLIWTIIGQIVYFSYGFRHSKRRVQLRENLFNSTNELLPSAESIVMEYMHTEPEPDLASEISENHEEDIIVQRL